MKKIEESQLNRFWGGSELSNAVWWLIGSGIGLMANAWDSYCANSGSSSYANGNRWH